MIEFRGEDLFSRTTLSDYLKWIENEANNYVSKYKQESLVRCDTSDILNQIRREFTFDIPRIHDDVDYNVEYPTVPMYRFEFGRTINTKVALHKYQFIYEGDDIFFFIQPFRAATPPPKGSVNDKKHSLEIIIETQLDCDAAYAAEAMISMLDKINRNLDEIKTHTMREYEAILERVSQVIELRRKDLLKSKKVLNDLGYKLLKRGDFPQTFPSQIKKKKVHLQQVNSSALHEEYPSLILDRTYEEILETITYTGIAIERTPSVAADAREEFLRDILLIPLNGVFEGQATGETFNRHGKTDILIKDKGANVFIAECKIWSGREAYLKAITQLQRYITWRDTKTSLIIFSRNRSFSRVLKTVEESTPLHPCYIKDEQPCQDRDRFKYMFRLRGDKDLEFMLTVLVFNIHCD